MTLCLDISTNYAGTVFRVSTNGELTSLVTFSDTNGWGPKGRLAWGPDGLLYGTTVYGGIGQGTVFKVTTNGELTSLISFGGTNGSYPHAGMTLGPDGNFYGTTQGGAYNNGDGTVFRITTNGDLTTVVPFHASGGSSPDADLLLAPDGKLYGTTPNSYVAASGTVFQVTTNGTLTILVSFNGPNGGLPRSGLTLGSDSNFYGVASVGGPSGYGTVFRLNTRPRFTGVSKQGQSVSVSGTGLPNDPCSLWATADLSSVPITWAFATNGFFSVEGNISFRVPSANPSRFYRLGSP
jgi:uncharacterized repeat protein (TIGR03803 family)